MSTKDQKASTLVKIAQRIDQVVATSGILEAVVKATKGHLPETAKILKSSLASKPAAESRRETE